MSESSGYWFIGSNHYFHCVVKVVVLHKNQIFKSFLADVLDQWIDNFYVLVIVVVFFLPKE